MTRHHVRPHPRAAIRRSFVGTVALLALTLGATSCSSGPYRRAGYWAPEVAPVPMSAGAILAPAGSDVEGQLLDLERSPQAPAALLRRAWLRLGQGRAEAAVSLTERVLYSGEHRPGSVEAIARYIRAGAFESLGQTDRARFDLAEARRLATDPELRDRLLGPVLRAAEAPPSTKQQVAYRDRSAWSADQPVPSRLDPMGRIFRITVHHSAVPLRTNRETAARAAVRQIQREHMAGRNYGDIGYHFLIDPAGRIWAGRDTAWQGAHARGRHNEGNIGICVLGSFVRGGDGQAPTGAQVLALETLIDMLEKRYRIGRNQLHTHREFVATECPGAQLQSVVDEMRQLRTTARR